MSAATSDPNEGRTPLRIIMQNMVVAASFQSARPANRFVKDKPLEVPYQAEIVDLFMHYEASIGVRSNQGAAVAALEGMRGCFDVWRESDLERAIDSGKVREAALVRKTLMRMQENGRGREVVVLWRMLGPRRASENAVFDQFAPIVDMVAEVEGAREELALVLGEERQAHVAETFGVDDKKVCLESEFWEIAGYVTALNDKIEKRLVSARCSTPKGVEITNAMQERYEAYFPMLSGILEAFRTSQSAQLRGEITALASADHEKTHAEAIRTQLAAYTGPKDKVSGKPLKGDQLDAHNRRREEFIARVRMQATLLFTRAGAAYAQATEEFSELRAIVESTKRRNADGRRRGSC